MGGATHDQSLPKRVLFVTLMITVSVVLTEGALRLLTLFSERAAMVLRVEGAGAAGVQPLPDARLGHRPDPAHPEHDAWGFRNRALPEHADVVALGDSHTYGQSAAPHEAWPQQLGELGGVTVYNLGYGGYGPTESLLLLEQALVLGPRLVLLGFYTGNDAFDCYEMVYARGALQEFATTDAELRRRIQASERAAPFSASVQRRPPGTGGAGSGGALRTFLSRHSRLYAVARAARDLAVAEVGLPPPGWQRELAQVERSGGELVAFQDGDLRTVFASRYRLQGVDWRDFRIREGGRVCLAAIRAMGRRASDANAAFLVVLIPTKHLVFADAVAARGAVGPAYAELLAGERALRESTRRALRAAGIDFVDALPALRERVAAGEQPYPANADGHPNAVGYRAIAEVVLAGARDRGVL